MAPFPLGHSWVFSKSAVHQYVTINLNAVKIVRYITGAPSGDINLGEDNVKDGHEVDTSFGITAKR